MSFLEDLPSVPSSKFTKKDIELFDKYRKRYRKTVEEIKNFLAHTQTTIDIDSIHSCWPDLDEALVENNLGNNTGESYWNDYQECDGAVFCDTYAVPIKKGFHGKKMLHHIVTKTYIKKFDCYRSGVKYFNNSIILALYIPEDLEWLRLYLGLNCRGSRRSTLGLIGYYEKGGFSFSEGGNRERMDLSFEAILKRSKDYSFLHEEARNFNLEAILKNSKKRFIIPDGYGKEIMIINGKRYKRVVLVHPGLPIKGGIPGLGIYIETPEKVCVYVEGIYSDGLLSDSKIPFNYKDNLYFSYIGPIDLDPFEDESRCHKGILKEYRMLSFHKYQIDEIVE